MSIYALVTVDLNSRIRYCIQELTVVRCCAQDLHNIRPIKTLSQPSFLPSLPLPFSPSPLPFSFLCGASGPCHQMNMTISHRGKIPGVLPRANRASLASQTELMRSIFPWIPPYSMLIKSLSTWSKVHKLLHQGLSESVCFTKLLHWRRAFSPEAFIARTWSHMASQATPLPLPTTTAAVAARLCCPCCWHWRYVVASRLEPWLLALCRLPKPPYFPSRGCNPFDLS